MMRGLQVVAACLIILTITVASVDAAKKCGAGKRPVQTLARLTTNGCGTGGLKLSTGEHDFTPCCDQHDACYGACGAKYSKCESDFKKCMATYCKEKHPSTAQDCQQSANMYAMGTSMFGQSAFDKSQDEACECVDEKGSRALDRYTEVATLHYHSAGFGGAELQERVDTIRAKFEEKRAKKGEWRTLLALVSKYPNSLERLKDSESGGDSVEL